MYTISIKKITDWEAHLIWHQNKKETVVAIVTADNWQQLQYEMANANFVDKLNL